MLETFLSDEGPTLETFLSHEGPTLETFLSHEVPMLETFLSDEGSTLETFLSHEGPYTRNISLWRRAYALFVKTLVLPKAQAAWGQVAHKIKHQTDAAFPKDDLTLLLTWVVYILPYFGVPCLNYA